MEKALILNKEDLDRFSEVRHAVVAMGAAYLLYKRGSLTMEVAFGRIVDEIRKADDAIEFLSRGGL
jgi:hypothetical protein